MKKVTRLSALMVTLLLSAFLFSVPIYAQNMVEIGTGTSSNGRIPAYFYYNYSWGTAIYLDSEIGLDEPYLFTKISYHVANCPSPYYYAMNQKIWMRHTDLGQFADYNYPDPYSDPSWTLVKDGFEVWWITQSWVDFQLDSPFVYDGVSNIEILWENWDGSYDYPYPYFYYTYQSNRCKYKYSDGGFPTGSGYRSGYVAHLRIYYEPLVPGTIDGTVTDVITGLPIIGAKVTAGNNYGVSLADGTYSFEAQPFTFDVTCEKAGYATAIAYDITVVGEETVTVDFTLTEDAVPPSGVHAEIREIDLDVVDVTWGVPYGLYEIIYDDGAYENMTAWLEAGSLNALRFTPIAYPCAIESGSVHIGDGTYPPDGDALQEFSMAVYAADGANGYPGTLLGGIADITPVDFGWVVVDLSSLGITIESGDFYIAMQQGTDYPDCAPIAVDETNPSMRSFSKYQTGPWIPAGYNDFMIRAICSGPGGQGGPLSPTNQNFVENSRISEHSVFMNPPTDAEGFMREGEYFPRGGETPRDLDHYAIYRVNEGDENNPELWTLLSGFITNEAYTDNQWESLPDGGYRWAVEAVYSGATSEAALSNMLGKNWYSEVTINVALSSGNSPEGAQVILTNEDGLPAHQYTAIVPASGVVVFPEVWNGTYDMMVMLFGYDLWEMLDFDITGDMTIEVLLMETTYPPSALYVDPLTLIATWLAPGVSLDLLDEDWESGSFATNEWTFDPSQGNWNISSPGNPGVSAEFYYSPTITNYSHALVSKEFSGLGMPDIIFEWDLYLSNYSTATTENIDVEVYNGTDWVLIKHYDNQGGSIPWTHESFNITAHVQGVPDFKVRFTAWGADSWNINNYNIDNVLIYGEVEDDNRAVMGYNVYLDDAIAGFTTETWFQYPSFLILWGEYYLSSVEAVYASGISDRIYYGWTSIYLPPPNELEGEDVGHTAHLTWEPPIIGGVPDGATWAEVLEYNNMSMGDLYQDMSEPSDGLAPIGLHQPILLKSPNEGIDAITDKGFAYNAYPNGSSDPIGPMSFRLYDPGNVTNIGPALPDFVAAGEWALDTWWGVIYGGTLVTIDTLTGTYTVIASTVDASGLGWDETTQTMYACTYSGGNIYTIDLATGASTLIGSTGVSLITMTCSAEGTLYGIDMAADYFGMIDKTTGLFTPMTPLGFNANYAQDMACDRSENVIYYAPFNNTAFAGQLWMIEPVSGMMTYINDFEGGMEVTGFGIPGGGGLTPDNLIAYNIYRDGSYLDQVDFETTEYFDEGLLAGWYSYSVTAVYGDPTPGESMHEGPIDVYIEGEGNIEGTVTQYGSQPVPIVGATVTATSEFDTYVTTTGAGGVYILADVNEGTYTVCAVADGFMEECVVDVFVGDEETVTVNFELLEFPFPALGVYAERSFPDHQEVYVDWYEYGDFYEISYDDGIADNVTAWNEAGNMNALRFTPAGYPAEIFSAQIHIFDGSWPPGNVLTTFDVAIYDDNGPDGLPGTELALTTVTPFDYGWVNVDFSQFGVSIPDGDFYVVMIQGGDFPDCAPIAIDETAPVYRSYSRLVTENMPWRPADFADYMMRAFVYSEVDGAQILSYNDKIDIPESKTTALSMSAPNVEPGTYDVGFGRFIPKGEAEDLRAFDHYEVWVLSEGDELEPGLWILKDDAVLDTEYTDTDWPDYLKGWYRYAVVSVYSYNQSEAAFSNLVPRGYDHTVTINIHTNTGDSPAGALVTFFNQNGDPDLYFEAIAPDDGTVVFNEVWEGSYTLQVTLDYYNPYELNNIYLDSDININVTLHEIFLPPQQFHVNSMTGVATWLPPVLDYYTVFEEGFEDGFIPAGWTQEYLLENQPWTVQAGSPSGTPDFAHGGEFNAAFVGSSVITRLVTPEIDLGGEILPKLTFWHTQAAGAGQDELKVYYRTSTTAIWKPLTSFFQDMPVWTKEVLNLPSPTSNYQLGFMGDNPEPSGMGICLDDVVVTAGIDPIGTDEVRILEGYNVYLDGEQMAFTTELTYTYTDLVIGQFYVGGVDAQYTGGNSIIVQYPFTYYTCDFFFAPENFEGSVSGMTVTLIWDPPPGIEPVEYEIIYDDGTMENAVAWNVVNSQFAVRFTPGGYPCDILEFQMHIWDGTWPAGDILNPMQIIVYDDDGPNGFPGTELGMIEVTPANYNWVTFDISSLGVTINSGDFYLAHKQIGTYPNCPPTAVDESSAGQGRSYRCVAGDPWLAETDYDQLAIRAKVFGPVFGDQILAPVTVPISGTTLADQVESVNTAPMALTSGEVKLGGSEYILPDGRSRFTLMGYNVYKDDVVLNGEVLTANMYVDVCSPGGIYYYNVTAVYNMGESCPIDPPYEAIVGEEFPPPTDLTGQALEGDDVLLTWNEPGESTGQWIHWDDGENYNAIGLTSGGTFMVASRWGTADLVPFDGMFLTKVSLFPNYDGIGPTGFALKVWTGDNAGTLVVDMPLSNLIMNAWNTITLTDPVLVDATQELWFGYECIDQPEGEHPAGTDDGPAVAGYGDMISMDGGVIWDPLSGFGLDYNWNLQAYVTSEADYVPLSPLSQELIVNTGDVYPDAVRNEFTEASLFLGDDNSRQMLLGYNLWKNGENFVYVPAPDTFYIDPALAPGTYEYYVSAVYAEGESFWDGPAVVTITPKGDIAGYVYAGETGTPISGAIITADPGGFTTTTGYDGTYLLENLPVGSYSVTASATPDYVDKTLYTEVFNAEVSVVDFAMYDDSVFPVPFYEPWDDGSFETQFWTFDAEPGNWQMDTGFGHPAPSAKFSWNPRIYDYSFALVSPQIDATAAIQNVTLCFDLYLSDFSSTGLEYMTVDVWDGTSWIMIDEWSNVGSFDWTSMSYDITEYALGILTQVRFVAHGADSYEINNWDLDNIMVYEQIMASLQGTITELAGGDPIENAEITVEGYNPVYTNADGFYSIAVEQGTYAVSCEADGFNPVSDELFIDNTVWDVAMTQPIMTVEPLSIFQQLHQGETATQYFTIYNGGNGLLQWDATIVETDFAPVDNLELISYERENIEELNPNMDWSPRVTEVVNGNTDEMWDVQFVYDVTAASGGINAQAGAEFDGTYFYTTIWSGSDILKYDIDGNYIGAFAISGASGIRDLAWDGEYLYGGNAGNVIYQIDPETFNVVDQFSSPEVVRAIAYDEVYDAFWVCNWATDFWLVARDGSMLDVIPNPGVESVYGLAYDNLTGAPSLWIFSQQTGGSDFIQLDIGSGTFTGVTHNVLNDIPLDGIAGGAFISTDFIAGTVTLGGLIQMDDFNTIFGYELGTYDMWLTVIPTSGTIPDGGSQEVEVYFDAAGLEPIDYYADIVIESTPYVGTAVIEVHLDVAVGLDELINSGLISVYPNPATDYVNVVVTEEVREFRILSYIGQVVYEHNFAEGELLTQVNTTRFTAGTYLVEFTTQDGEVFTKSVVISR